jgi:hypothetical protein
MPSFAGTKGCSVSAEKEAVRILVKKIRTEALYTWEKDNCVHFFPEGCDARSVDIAVREVHTEDCGGDQHVMPIRDRFRVHRKSKKVEWYYAPDGEYLDFEKIHSVGHR